MAATNRVDILKTLPFYVGRFDKKKLELEGRILKVEEILKVHVEETSWRGCRFT